MVAAGVSEPAYMTCCFDMISVEYAAGENMRTAPSLSVHLNEKLAPTDAKPMPLKGVEQRVQKTY